MGAIFLVLYNSKTIYKVVTRARTELQRLDCLSDVCRHTANFERLKIMSSSHGSLLKKNDLSSSHEILPSQQSWPSGPPFGSRCRDQHTHHPYLSTADIAIIKRHN